MTRKKLLILTAVIFISEIIVLIVFGGFSPDAEKEDEVLLKFGPVDIYKYDMGLVDFQNVPQWNIDGTPEGEYTFWGFNKTTTVMLVLIEVFIIIRTDKGYEEIFSPGFKKYLSN